MRRALIIMALALALTAAPVALGGSKRFSGAVSGAAPGKVEFTASGGGDPYAKVKDFDFANTRFECTGEGPSEIGAVFEGTIAVDGRGQFSGVQRETGTKMTVKGAFASARRATGTFRLELSNPDFGECDTGDVRWKASR
jgi:hypothetical protein